ncbi:mycofactocin biosynthesis peptidyl-dipeptidase MftE [Pseudonocardia sp.]|uniref:mycofactocin biosynthesis peptidyl-dipeptidase MftE n=1 Tax=Pseudonocardia sp. TaxID=60912 RepID=UPI003D0998EC
MTGELGGAVWPEVGGATLLVPVGSTEQHGPHLPLDTDTRIAVAVASRAAAAAGAVVTPPVGFTASGEHEGFPGTISIGHDALAAVLVEIGRSACRWAPRLVFVNGHGGNLPTLPSAVRRLRDEGRDVAWFVCGVPGGDAHAGRSETSILLALDPGSVRLDRAEAGATAPLPELLDALRAGGVVAVSPSGVLGDPTGATAEEGGAMLAAMTSALVAGLRLWAPGRDGRL